jgi:GT2 family glycosyltransferase
MKISPLQIIIISNNRREEIFDCLASLYRCNYTDYRILQLDNGSEDETLDIIREKYADVEIVPLVKNLGYAGNNNIGIKMAIENGAKWILLLNDDVVLDPDCLTAMLAVGDSDPRIGVVGPLVYHHNEPNVIQSAGGLLGKRWESIHLGKNEQDIGQYEIPSQVEWISGCAIMVRREAIEQVGMLDQTYFMYWEETEWCIRLARAGWKIFMTPEAKIWHKGVQRDYQPTPSFTYYGTRNHLLTLAKHRAPFRAKVYTWLQYCRTLLSWSIRPKWRAKREHRNAMWKGMTDFLHRRSGPMAS